MIFNFSNPRLFMYNFIYYPENVIIVLWNKNCIPKNISYKGSAVHRHKSRQDVLIVLTVQSKLSLFFTRSNFGIYFTFIQIQDQNDHEIVRFQMLMHY